MNCIYNNEKLRTTSKGWLRRMFYIIPKLITMPLKLELNKVKIYFLLWYQGKKMSNLIDKQI